MNITLDIVKESYYLRRSLLSVEEDLTHEFKGHRCLSSMDLSDKTHTLDRNGNECVPKVKYARRPLSAYLCGMLNTGKGGTFFLGVEDGGRVEGLMMTEFQMEHLLLSLRDLFNEFRPKVPDHFYHVKFIPVRDPNEGPSEAVKKCKPNAR
jgi:hypothetical protein